MSDNATTVLPSMCRCLLFATSLWQHMVPPCGGSLIINVWLKIVCWVDLIWLSWWGWKLLWLLLCAASMVHSCKYAKLHCVPLLDVCQHSGNTTAVVRWHTNWFGLIQQFHIAFCRVMDQPELKCFGEYEVLLAEESKLQSLIVTIPHSKRVSRNALGSVQRRKLL